MTWQLRLLLTEVRFDVLFKTTIIQWEMQLLILRKYNSKRGNTIFVVL